MIPDLAVGRDPRVEIDLDDHAAALWVCRRPNHQGSGPNTDTKLATVNMRAASATRYNGHLTGATSIALPRLESTLESANREVMMPAPAAVETEAARRASSAATASARAARRGSRPAAA